MKSKWIAGVLLAVLLLAPSVAYAHNPNSYVQDSASHGLWIIKNFSDHDEDGWFGYTFDSTCSIYQYITNIVNDGATKWNNVAGNQVNIFYTNAMGPNVATIFVDTSTGNTADAQYLAGGYDAYYHTDMNSVGTKITFNYNRTLYITAATAAHEFGHAIGLRDNTNSTVLMFQQYWRPNNPTSYDDWGARVICGQHSSHSFVGGVCQSCSGLQ